MKRVFAVLGSAFFSGALFASLLPSVWQGVLFGVCLVTALLLVLFCRKRSAYIAFFLAAAVAVALFCVRDFLEYQPNLIYADTEQVVVGEILSSAKRANGGYSYELRTTRIGGDAGRCSILLFTTGAMEAEVGDTVMLPVSLRLPDQRTFDGVRYYKSQHLYLLGSGVAEGAQVTKASTVSLLEQLRRANGYLAKRLDETLSPETASVVQSMVLGDRSRLDPVLAQSYITAGAYHLFSVSGLHLSILCGALLLLFRPLGRRWSAFLTVPVLVFFLLFTGMQLSTVRSCIMVVLLLAGHVCYQRSDPLNALGLAATVILGVDSYAILDVGFLLSFAATFGIVCIYPRLSQWQPHRILQRQPLAFCWRTALFSVSVSLPMLPVYVFTFGYLPLWTPLANLLVLPIATTALLGGFLLCVLLPFCDPTLLAVGLDVLVQVQNGVTACLARLPGTLGLNYPPFYVAIPFLGVLLLVYWRFRLPVWRRVVALSAGAIGAVCMIWSVSLPQTTTGLFVVGSGRAANLIFLDNGYCTVLSMQDDSYADRVTMDFLRGKGIDQIDAFVLGYRSFSSYEDTRLLLSSFPVKQVFYHRDNLLAKHLLQELLPEQAVVPIEALELETDALALRAEYRQRALCLTASFQEVPIFIGTPTQAKGQTASLYFYKTPVNQPTYPAITWLLAEPYEELEGEMATAYDRVLAFTFHSEGRVFLREEGFF